jgi:FKBP-type peptidyl-prolyl cis-trans isomerase
MQQKDYKLKFDYRNILIVLLFVAVATAAIVGGSILIGKKDSVDSGDDSSEFNVEEEMTDQQDTQDTQGLQIEDIEVGSGQEAQVGSTVSVHYTGTLTDGTKFDSSLDRGEPFSFTIGSGQVISGWELGVKGMKVGGKRKLTIPPELGYKDREVGSIPANSTLLFEIELLSVE